MRTNAFTISRKKMATLMFLDNGLQIWLIPLLIIIASIVTLAVTDDYRWLIVALMALFIIIPMYASLLYIEKGFKPVTAMNSNTHSLMIDDSSIVVINRVPEFEEDEQTGTRTYEYKIPFSKISSWKTGCDEIIFKIGLKGKEGMLIVSQSAFSDSESFKNFINFIVNRINSK